MAVLSGSEYETLLEAIVAAFPDRPRLERMLRFRLNKHLERISGIGPLDAVVYDVIQAAEAEGWTAALIDAARRQNPGNPQLTQLDLDLRAALPPGANLERMIDPTKGFIDITTWSTRLFEIERQVCAVEIGSKHVGTGLLVGKDAVLTNFHVMASVVNGQARPSDVKVRFDFKKLRDGRTVHPGIEFKLADAWLIDSSPYSRVDSEPYSEAKLPGPEQLDYALVRVEGDPGNTKSHARDDGPRRWATVPPTEYSFSPGSFLMVVQHPCGEPLKIAIDDEGVIGLNGNQTRVRYRTNTEPGSSGSPCFNNQMQLVALHHAGEPSQQWPPADPCAGEIDRADYNQGIPTHQIRKLVVHRGFGNVFGD